MTKEQQKQMFAYMKDVDDPLASDGGWHAQLEDAAEAWGEENNVKVDGFDAFMDYLDYLENH